MQKTDSQTKTLKIRHYSKLKKNTIRHFHASAVFVSCWRIPKFEFYRIRQVDSPGKQIIPVCADILKAEVQVKVSCLYPAYRVYDRLILSTFNKLRE